MYLIIERMDLKKRPRPFETLVRSFLFLCAAFSILITFGIIYEIGKALLFFGSPEVNIREFLFGTRWQPQAADFGILPLLNATLTTTLFAMIVALPLGLGVAIYLSEYATKRTRNLLKPVLEILAGIPTVVYGFFALTFMTPLLRSIWNDVFIYNTSRLIMGILILPLVASMCEDAFSGTTI